MLPRDRWRELLEETGFAQSVVLSSTLEEGGVFSRQAVIIAQAASLGETWPEERRSVGWLADSRGIGRYLCERLQSRGDICTLVLPGTEYQPDAEREVSIDPTRPDHFERLLNQTADEAPLRGVVNLWGLETVAAANLTRDDLDAASRLGCGSALHLVQSLAKMKSGKPPALWLVTRGAQPGGATWTFRGSADLVRRGLGVSVSSIQNSAAFESTWIPGVKRPRIRPGICSRKSARDLEKTRLRSEPKFVTWLGSCATPDEIP